MPTDWPQMIGSYMPMEMLSQLDWAQMIASLMPMEIHSELYV